MGCGEGWGDHEHPPLPPHPREPDFSSLFYKSLIYSLHHSQRGPYQLCESLHVSPSLGSLHICISHKASSSSHRGSGLGRRCDALQNRKQAAAAALSLNLQLSSGLLLNIVCTVSQRCRLSTLFKRPETKCHAFFLV